MAWYDDRDGTKVLTNPNAFGAKGSNGTVKRIVIHTVGLEGAGAQTNMDQAQICWNTWNGESTKDFHVSAHFCVELDGRVIQFVDTADIAYGTGWLTSGSVHIEHAGNNPFEMTDVQLHNSADLVGWLKMMHKDLTLEVNGTSISDPGDPEKPGITCHRFIQEVYHKKWPTKSLTWKACPGTGIIGQLPLLSSLAKTYYGVMYS
jgi:hypothetical protein